VKDHEYFVYIVCSRSGTLYTGMTSSIYRRALEHKRGEVEGFASRYHCDRLVYYENFDDVHKAIGREKQLKGWSRAKKIVLIESKNRRWEDLAEKWGADGFCRGSDQRPMRELPDMSAMVLTDMGSFDYASRFASLIGSLRSG